MPWLEHAPKATQYLMSLYWSAVTAATVGYGDVVCTPYYLTSGPHPQCKRSVGMRLRGGVAALIFVRDAPSTDARWRRRSDTDGHLHLSERLAGGQHRGRHLCNRVHRGHGHGATQDNHPPLRTGARSRSRSLGRVEEVRSLGRAVGYRLGAVHIRVSCFPRADSCWPPDGRCSSMSVSRQTSSSRPGSICASLWTPRVQTSTPSQLQSGRASVSSVLEAHFRPCPSCAACRTSSLPTASAA